ncbi:hypothetical protein Syn7502_01066 [Synechococcus sp. PCC 7502]|uniref:hypothetical protein n=1 Tax=Synechococcus sp. PCC 7502 TaxID=1173263 RepID=UPI00029FC0AE|nr:hypothetical protein [Synechococcus sp. PCC 7502]AFY73176.1 hypothetical protein Syn7502_01066 [Synechococcus sp. PCC 7502]
MTNKLVLILVGLLIVEFALLGFLATPYYIGKLAATALPAYTLVSGVPIWVLRIMLQFQKFWNVVLTLFVIFHEVIFLYFVPLLIILGLRLPRTNWVKVCAISYGVGFLVLLSTFLNTINFSVTLAIAVIALGVFTGALIRLFWQARFHKIYSVSTVVFGIILGKVLGVFAIAAIFSVQTVGAFPIQWTTLLMPIFLLLLCLALSLRYQFKRDS